MITGRHFYKHRPQLAVTREKHYCPKCQFYAYHNHPKQTQVVVGNRIHHPNCSIVSTGRNIKRPAQPMMTGNVVTGGTVEDNKDAPFVVLGAIGIGLVIAAIKH